MTPQHQDHGQAGRLVSAAAQGRSKSAAAVLCRLQADGAFTVQPAGQTGKGQQGGVGQSRCAGQAGWCPQDQACRQGKAIDGTRTRCGRQEAVDECRVTAVVSQPLSTQCDRLLPGLSNSKGSCTPTQSGGGTSMAIMRRQAQISPACNAASRSSGPGRGRHMPPCWPVSRTCPLLQESASMPPTCQDLEVVLGLVQAPQAAQAACHHQPQRQGKAGQGLMPRSPAAHAPLQALDCRSDHVQRVSDAAGACRHRLLCDLDSQGSPWQLRRPFQLQLQRRCWVQQAKVPSGPKILTSPA